MNSLIRPPRSADNQEAHRSSVYRALIAAGLRYDGLKLREIAALMGGVHIVTAMSAVQKGHRLLERRYVALNECAELVARGSLPAKESQ